MHKYTDKKENDKKATCKYVFKYGKLAAFLFGRWRCWTVAGSRPGTWLAVARWRCGAAVRASVTSWS